MERTKKCLQERSLQERSLRNGELLERLEANGITGVVLTGIPEWDALKDIDSNLPVREQAATMAKAMEAMAKHIPGLLLPPFTQLVEEMEESLMAVTESGKLGEPL